MKPTPEQIEKYIQAADAELGPLCTHEWVEWCRQALRASLVDPEIEITVRTDGVGGGQGSTE